MTAMMIDDGKRVAAGRARLQWHMIPIADIDLIARNTRGEESVLVVAALLRSAPDASHREAATVETAAKPAKFANARTRSPTREARALPRQIT